MNKYISYVGVIALAVGVATAADARGPKFSVDVMAYCGDPVAVDEFGNPVGDENVAVIINDASDDNGPAGATVGLLEVSCTAKVQEGGRGRPVQAEFATILVPDPGFGTISATCPLGALPDGATEWKATATVSEGDVRRPVSDSCEEVPVM